MIIDDGRLEQRSIGWRIIDYCWGIFPALSSLCVLLALWQYGYQHIGAFLLPPPDTVLSRVVALVGETQGASVLITLYRGAIGLLLALSIGIAAGLLAGLNRSCSLFMRPLVTMLLGTPPIIWVVLALFWFGMGSSGIIFTVILAVSPMVFAAAMQSMLSVDVELREMLEVYQLSRIAKCRYLYIPHCLSRLLPAIIVATGTGLKITVMAELLGGNDGLGADIANARSMMDTTDVMAYVVLIITIIMVIEYVVLEPLRRWLMPWEQQRAIYR